MKPSEIKEYKAALINAPVFALDCVYKMENILIAEAEAEKKNKGGKE